LLALVAGEWEEAERLIRKQAPHPATLSQVIQDCDIKPSLHAILEAADRFDLVPVEVRGGLDQARHKCRMDNILLLAEAEKVIDAMAGAGVIPVVLKGLDIIHRFDLGFDSRRMTDMDLLVPAGDVRKTMQALAKAGWDLPAKIYDSNWAPYHTGLDSSGPVSVSLEVHWNIIQEGRYSLDPADLIQRAGKLELGGRPVLGLERHDLAAHTLLHHVSSHFHRTLKNWIDLRYLSQEPGFDWSLVARRVNEWGGAPGAAMAMRHLGKLLPTWFPAEVVELFPISAARHAVLKPTISDHPLDMFRSTTNRLVEIFLSSILVNQPWRLPFALRVVRGEPDYLKGVLDVDG
jgi:hypothetical protein